jgi:oligopeptidase A
VTTELLLNNPLLHFSGLPKFEEVKAEHVSPAIDYLLTEARATVETLALSKDEVTWDNFAAKLEDMQEKTSRAWSQVGHMNGVVNSPELREAYNANLSKLTDFYADLGQDERLYAKFRTLRASSQFDTLSPSRKKIVENELRSFRLGGAELPTEQKARFKAIQEELSKLSAKFEENVLDNTNDFALFVEEADTLAGIPEDVLQTASEAAKPKVNQAGNLPYISLHTYPFCNMRKIVSYVKRFTVLTPHVLQSLESPMNLANPSGITRR